jgi:hypothetical protein
MTLAAILFCGVLCATPPPSLISTSANQSAPQSASPDKPADSSSQDFSSQNQSGQDQNRQNQASAPSQKSASPAQGQSSPSHSSPPNSTSHSASTPSPAAKPATDQNQASVAKHRKKTAADCVPPPAASGVSASATTAKTTPGQAAAGANSSAANAPLNCPPTKTIVRQGGTKEPSIELIGGATGDQQSQRDLANQRLQATDANLKKIAGEPLNANQQVLVAQIRQFMQQSRSAVQAGEFERADTLAKKAQQLSEELVKPVTQ